MRERERVIWRDGVRRRGEGRREGGRKECERKGTSRLEGWSEKRRGREGE